MPKKRLTAALSAVFSVAGGRPTLSTVKKHIHLELPTGATPSSPSTPRPVRRSADVPTQVLSRLKLAEEERRSIEEASAGEAWAAPVTNEISSILRGGDDAVCSPCSLEPNNRMLEKNILDVQWFSDMPGTVTTQRRKEVSRERKQKYIYNNTESHRFTKLMRMCADNLGTDSTLEIFDKLGRVTGMKECNTLIKLLIGNARSSKNSKDEKESLVDAVYDLLASMRERGFSIEEESYSPFLMYMIDMGMQEHFITFCKRIRDQNLGSHIRIGYYEMLYWTRAGDEEKIQELCDSLRVDNTEERDSLAESFLLAFCESSRKEGLQQLLEVFDISRISSPDYVRSIFRSLGRLQLERLVEKYILSLIATGTESEDLSTLIFDYADSIPELAVEEVVSKFNALHEKLQVVPSVVSYEKLITHCCNSFQVSTALAVADYMCQHGLDATNETFHTILRACDHNCEPDMVRPIYSVMCRNNVKPNGDTYTIMINLCVKIKDFESAYNLLADAAEMNEVPTTGMYNAILAGYFREKNFHRALKVLKQMKDVGVKPDSETFNYLILNCKREEDIAKYRDEMERCGIPLTKYVYMSLVNAYVTFGKYELAKQVLLDLELPVKSLNDIKGVLIAALSYKNQISDALIVYDEMKRTGGSLGTRATISLIENIRSEGELDRLLQLLESLADSNYWFEGCDRVLLYCVQHNLTTSAVELLKQLKFKDEPSTYRILDQMFSHIQNTEPINLQMGLDLLHAVQELDLRPSRTSLDFFLSACVKAKNPQIARLVWSEYSNAGLSYNVLSFLRMYQVFLASGQHKAATKILQRISRDDPHVCEIVESCKLAFKKQ